MEPNEAFILGALLGDGCLTMRAEKGDFTIEFDQKNREWLETLSKKFESCFSKTSLVRKTTKGYFRLRIHSKRIFGQLQRMKLEFPENILDRDNACKIKFLQAMLDSEGSVDKNKFRIRFANKNGKLIEVCKTLLEELGITTGKISINKRTGVKSLPIHGKDRMVKFDGVVGFTHPEKMMKLDLLIST